MHKRFNPRDIMCHALRCRSISEKNLKWFIDIQNIIDFGVITVLASGLTPSRDKASAGTIMTIFDPYIHTGWELEGLTPSAEAGLFLKNKVKSMAADAIASRIACLLTAMVLNMQDKRILAFHYSSGSPSLLFHCVGHSGDRSHDNAIK